jgi:hypothetical protein
MRYPSARFRRRRRQVHLASRLLSFSFVLATGLCENYHEEILKMVFENEAKVKRSVQIRSSFGQSV